MERYTISGKKTNNPQIVRHPDFTHPHLIKYAFYSDEKIIMVDSEGNIFYKEKGKLHFIRKLKQLIQKVVKLEPLFLMTTMFLSDLRQMVLYDLWLNKITKQRSSTLIVVYSLYGKINKRYYLDWYRWAGGICLDKRRIYIY